MILDKNALPFITGTLCAHNCMYKCTRNFYETPVHIREMKLKAAENGYEALLEKLPVPAVTKAGKAAVIGGGSARNGGCILPQKKVVWKLRYLRQKNL